MPQFAITIWFSEEVYGKAYTQIEAANKEEAEAKFNKEIEAGNEFKMEWDYKIKDGGELIHDYEEVNVTEIKREIP